MYSSPNWQKQGVWSKKFYKNPYTYYYDSSTVNAMSKAMLEDMLNKEEREEYVEPVKKRSGLDRVFDALLLPNYAIAGFVDGIVDGRGGRTPLQGAWEGIKAANPFGQGFEKGETTFSDVIRSAGVNPTSTLGKIGVGTAGFALDIALDPTTYLTGGVSAIVKGTGRVGKTVQTLEKASKSVAEAIEFNKRYDDLIQKGVSHNEAVGLAELRAKNVKIKPDKITHMTDEMAKNIILQNSRRTGTEIKNIDVEATRFADKYNELLGIRDARGAGEITWGIGNMPFAPKSWRDKVVKIGSDEPLRKISDATGISRVYAGLRNSIYGTQIGRLLSSKSGLYRLAHEEPGKLWNAIDFIAHTRGLKMDKIQEEREIRRYFNSLDLTPAENKEILELLQDKTIWKKVSEITNKTKQENTKIIRNAVSERVAKLNSEIEELRELTSNRAMLNDAIKNDLINEKEALAKLESELEQKLLEIDTKYIKEREDVQLLIKTYSDEIEKLKQPKSDIDMLNKLYEEAKRERAEMAKHMKQKTEALEADGLKVTRESREKLTMDKLLKKADSAPGRKNSQKLIDMLSAYAYGETGHLSSRLGDNAIDELMEIVQRGGKPEDLRWFIDNNPKLYSPHALDVNQFVAKELGYDNWENHFKEILGKILRKSDSEIKKMTSKELHREASMKFKMNEFDEYQERAFVNILKKRYKRDVMRREYFKMDPEEFRHVRTQRANEELARELADIIDDEGYLSLRREDFIDDDFHFDRAYEDRFHLYESKRATGENPYIQSRPYLEHITSVDAPDILDDMIRFDFFKSDAIVNRSGGFAEFLDKTIKELDSVSLVKFKTSYVDMSDAQKKYALSLAMDNVLKGRGIDPKLAKQVVEEARKSVYEEVKRIKKEHKHLKDMTPEEIFTKTDVAVSEIGRQKILQEDLAKAQEKLQELGARTAQEKNELISEYEARINKQRENITKLEEKYKAFREIDLDADNANIMKLQNEIDELENALRNDDAFDTWMQSKSETYTRIVDELELNQDVAEDMADAGKLYLDERASSERIAEIVRTLRHKFDEIGRKEVEIGKLTHEQFVANMENYVPHILTPEGKDYMTRMKDLSEQGSKLTHDLGYGLKFNPHAKSRTIKGKTIQEINDHFREVLQGKNLFSENIADIYLARAMKHTELMYDDKYMRTMLNTFGKDIGQEVKIEDGYKAVMNYGMMRETTRDMASMMLSTRISRDVAEFLRKEFRAIQDMAIKSNLDVNELVSKEVDAFLAKNYPDDKISDMWSKMHDYVLGETGLPGSVADYEALPMVELDKEQIISLRELWSRVRDEQLQVLQSSMETAIRRNDFSRIKELDERLKRVEKATPPQIKQVNEVIVHEANKARKLQRAKDQNKFLQMYDKMLHFMKLNQTVIVPAFHARNKLSNMFNNWLVIGRDAFNKDWQMVAMKLAQFDGDRSKIKELIKNDKWKDRFRPINIPNPHPSLVDAVDLKYGQLHWEDAYDLAVQYGVIDTGQFARDIGAGARSEGLFKNLRLTRKDGTQMSLDPTDTSRFIGYELGTRIGTVVENSDRLINFVSSLKNGKSIDEARDISMKALFDYSDLTAFEQHVMKRIFPYYTWLRKNARLQVSQVIENPGKLRDVAKILNGIEHMNPIEDRMKSPFVSDWAQDWTQTPFSIQERPAEYDEDGNEIRPEVRKPIIFSANLPYMDFSRIPDPTRIDDTIKDLFTQTSPMIKNPVEIAMNKNVFFDSDLVEEGESAPSEYLKHLLNQFGLVNVAKGFSKDSVPELLLHLSNSVTGVKGTPYNYELSKWREIEKAREGGDRPIEDAIKRAIDKILEEREKRED